MPEPSERELHDANECVDDCLCCYLESVGYDLDELDDDNPYTP